MRDPKELRQLVQTAMDAILVRHDREEVQRHFHKDFVQHNPWAEDGGAHVEAMCDFEFGVKMGRWAVQGDLVAYHGYYTAPNPLGEHPLLCVDVWRVQGDQIVEHWDVLQPVPAAQIDVLVGSGGDGFAEVDPAQVAANASVARRLIELGVNQGNAALVDEILAEGFTVHRPDVEAGKSRDGFVNWMTNAKPAITVKRTIASGDLVFLQLLVAAGGSEQVVYDIFRFDAAGKITDQWMVAQARLPLAEAANPHPHF
ncbi:MAG: nuclear transport factor 2 family protein [Myxococcota bacterium]